jgi:hypothetical protein
MTGHECATPNLPASRSWKCRRCGAVWQLVPEFDPLAGTQDVWFKVTPSGPLRRFPWAALFMVAAAVVLVWWLVFTPVVHDAYSLIISMLLGASGLSWLLSGGVS